jgi:hypothetical protein
MNLTPTFSLLIIAPYLHVGYFFVGCWAGNAYVKLEKSMVEDINQIRQDKGMPPIVGTNAWIRYSEEQK